MNDNDMRERLIERFREIIRFEGSDDRASATQIADIVERLLKSDGAEMLTSRNIPDQKRGQNRTGE